MNREEDYINRRVREILQQEVRMGAGEGDYFQDDMDYVGGYAKGHLVTKAQYKKSWKKKHGNLKGFATAWNKLEAKRGNKVAKGKLAKKKMPKKKMAKKKKPKRKLMSKAEHRLKWIDKHGSAAGAEKAWKTVLARRKKKPKMVKAAGAYAGGAFVGGARRRRMAGRKRHSPYIAFLKQYAAKHGLSYGDAMHEVAANGLWR